MLQYKEEITNNGYTVIENVFDPDEIHSIISIINNVQHDNSSFRKTNDLFAIRRFLKEVPNAKPVIFNNKLRALIADLFGEGYFVVKSIYFDKPERSNWFVAWHQDLTISVDKKTVVPGYNSWTVKSNSFAVQPPEALLKDNFTIRIHIDDTTEKNGALKVIPGSHKSVERFETNSFDTVSGKICAVDKGGVMVMRPLLMHSSDRTVDDNKRRVIHIEFSKSILPEDLNWAEKDIIPN